MSNTETQVSTVKQLKEALSQFPDDYIIIGNCVDKEGNWYNYPTYVAKVPGNNTMVVIQLRPL